MTTYTPTTWATGDYITDVKLNKIENRITEIQSEGSIFQLSEPVKDNQDYSYFPNAPTWNELINYQDHGVPLVLQLPASLLYYGNRFETCIFMTRNAFPSNILSLYGEPPNTNPYPGNSIFAQSTPAWYFSTTIYVIIGIKLELQNGTWVPSGKFQMFYKTANSHDLYAAYNFRDFMEIPSLNMPYDNGGTGDPIIPGDGFCGCGTSGDRAGTRGIVDDGDYGCDSGSGGFGPKGDTKSDGDYSSCGGTNLRSGDYNVEQSLKSGELTKGSSSTKIGTSGDGDYCSGGSAADKSGDYNEPIST